MPKLKDFLKQLQNSHKSTKVKKSPSLIGKWANSEKKLVNRACAIIAKNLVNQKPPKFTPRITNQSLGNLYARFLLQTVENLNSKTNMALSNKFNLKFDVKLCKGSGYPDMIFKVQDQTKTLECVLEVKATAHWDPTDTNRRVLMSSVSKLEASIKKGALPNAPKHLLLTLVYSKTNGKVLKLRLDFLQPDFEISERIEASTSHKSLSSKKQSSSWH